MTTNTLKKGFSLIEIMVAVSLFTVVMTVSVGALLSLVEANRKVQALNSVMNNLNFALENMSRNIRVGSSYYCSNIITKKNEDVVRPQDCLNGGGLFAFERRGGDPTNNKDQVVFRFIDSRIEKSIESGENGTYLSITAPEVTITDMTFYAIGTTRIDTLQPRVRITIQGTAGISAKAQTDFSLQTTVTQRVLDL